MANLAHTRAQRPTYRCIHGRDATQKVIPILESGQLFLVISGTQSRESRIPLNAESGNLRNKDDKQGEHTLHQPQGVAIPVRMCTTISRLQKPALACIGYAMLMRPKMAETVVLTYPG